MFTVKDCISLFYCEWSAATELLLMYNGKPIVALKCLILVVEHSSRGHLGLIFNFKSIYVVNRPGPARPDPAVTLSVTLFAALYLWKYQSEMFQISHSGRYIPKLQRIKFWCPSLKYDRHQKILFRVEI